MHNVQKMQREKNLKKMKKTNKKGLTNPIKGCIIYHASRKRCERDQKFP